MGTNVYVKFKPLAIPVFISSTPFTAYIRLNSDIRYSVFNYEYF
jgi:hypothetical protein